ncbi:MAG: hypothetical protein AB7F19_07480 [Candidatus Babeliales bacterium]
MEVLFPAPTLSETEEEIIQTCLANPAVKKYFRIQAHNAAVSIVTGAPLPGEKPEDYLLRAAHVRGSMSAFEILLQVQAEKPNDQEE